MEPWERAWDRVWQEQSWLLRTLSVLAVSDWRISRRWFRFGYEAGVSDALDRVGEALRDQAGAFSSDELLALHEAIETSQGMNLTEASWAAFCSVRHKLWRMFSKQPHDGTSL